MSCVCKHILRKSLLLIAVIGLASSFQASAIQLQLSADLGASLHFNGAGPGGTFNFVNNSSGYSFIVETSDGLDVLGSATITGTYAIGSISSGGGGAESASVSVVSGPATLVIEDVNGDLFTASLTWNQIATSGTGGNLSATLSLASVSYSGSHSDLLTLASHNSGDMAVSFQFLPPKSLTELTGETAINDSRSFSGTISADDRNARVPDGGSTLILLGMALSAVGAWRGRAGLKRD
jgi:hypothetical protein